MTSTRGVTLMSASNCSSSSPPPPRLKAIPKSSLLGEVALRQIQEFEDEVVQPRLDSPHPLAEVVVADERRDGRREAGRGVDQRLGDAGRHRHDRRRARHADVLERHHDPPHRTEEADERAGRGGGGEKREPGRHTADLDPRRPHQRALQRGKGSDAVRPLLPRFFGVGSVLDLAVDLGIAGLEDPHQRRRAQLARRGVDLAETLAAVERFEELVGLRVGAAELEELADHDRPGAEREQRQGGQDGFRHRTGLREKRKQSGPLGFRPELEKEKCDQTHARSLMRCQNDARILSPTPAKQSTCPRSDLHDRRQGHPVAPEKLIAGGPDHRESLLQRVHPDRDLEIFRRSQAVADDLGFDPGAAPGPGPGTTPFYFSAAPKGSHGLEFLTQSCVDSDRSCRSRVVPWELGMQEKAQASGPETEKRAKRRELFPSFFMVVLIGIAYQEMVSASRESFRARGLTLGTVGLSLIFFLTAMRFFVGDYLHLQSGPMLSARGPVWFYDLMVIIAQATLLMYLGGLVSVEASKNSPVGFFWMLIILYASDVVWIISQALLGRLFHGWRRTFIPWPWCVLNSLLIGIMLLANASCSIYSAEGIWIMGLVNGLGFVMDMVLVDYYDML